MRVSLRLAVASAIAVTVLLSLGMTVASATVDTTSPALVDEQLTPAGIDPLSASTITVIVHATDAGSGVSDVGACFQSPSHAQTFCGSATVPFTGSSADGVYQVHVDFPPPRESGTWALAHVSLADQGGNLRYVYSSELDALQLPNAVRVDIGPTAPEPPTAASAVADNGEATVTWTAPTYDGGSSITGYEVFPYIDGTPQPVRTFTAPATVQTITGLTNGSSYTFRVAATNAQGTGSQSDPTNAVTPATVPDAPVIGAATRGLQQASLWWLAPANDGGATITGYKVTPYIGATPQPVRTFATATTIETITGLTNGITYSFRVAATNNQGTGPQSDFSNMVTPANRPPEANAGVNQTVRSGANFTLQGAASSDPDGDPLKYAWARVQGPQVTITKGTTATATVTGIKGPATLVFRLTVTDPLGHTSTDDVTVTVSSK